MHRIALIASFVCLAAACDKGKVCDPVEIPADFTGGDELAALAASGVVCHAHKRSITYQLPDADGDKGWMKTVGSTREAIAAQGWKLCEKRIHGNDLDENYIRGGEALSVSVSQVEGSVWAGTEVYIHHYDEVSEFSCNHLN